METLIKFKGQKYLFIKDHSHNGSGAIYDPEIYDNFGPAFMKLFPDGTIRRTDKEVVGSHKDIEWI